MGTTDDDGAAGSARPVPPQRRERPIALHTDDGQTLEARVALADAPGGRGQAVICHPHPLHGGTFDNKVVAVAARSAAVAGYDTLRFNFRGVGRSTGSHTGGPGELLDLEAALRGLAGLGGGGRPIVVGYSFGAAVAAEAVRRGQAVAALVLIGLPLATQPIAAPPLPPGGLHLICGPHDPFCPLMAARAFVAAYGDARATLRLVPHADHSFSGQLGPLAQAIAGALDTVAHAAAPT